VAAGFIDTGALNSARKRPLSLNLLALKFDDMERRGASPAPHTVKTKSIRRLALSFRRVLISIPDSQRVVASPMFFRRQARVYPLHLSLVMPSTQRS